MSTTNEITQRVIDVYNLFEKEGKVSGVAEFCLPLEYNPPAFYNILKGKQNATAELIKKIVDIYNISPYYLIKGEGSVMQDISTPIALVSYDLKNIYPHKLEDPNFLNGLRCAVLPFIEKPGSRAFQVEGEQMSKPDGEGLHDGEYVVGTKVELNDSELAFQFRHDRVHVVVTAEEYFVRRLRKTEKTSYITMHSDNKSYPIKRVPVKEIKELWYCHTRIGYHFPAPSSTDEAIRTLQEQMAAMQDIMRKIE